MNEEGPCEKFYLWHERKLESAFGALGRFISRHPIKIIALCILINGALMLGYLNLKVENDTETLFTPQNSQSTQDRTLMRNLYQNLPNLLPYQLDSFGSYVEVLIMSRNKSSIMSQMYVNEINSINFYITHRVSINNANLSSFTYQDFCVHHSSGCRMIGDFLLEPSFQRRFLEHNVTYPYYQGNLLSPVLSGVIADNGMLISTTGVKLRYYLQHNSLQYVSLWKKQFICDMKTFQTNFTDIAFAHSESLDKELEQNTNSDIKLFAITFMLMITFSCLALTSMNNNNIGNRQNIATPGVLAAVLAIGSSFGFVSAIGVDFTNIVGVMPFLVIGIGIDDMFILMSGLADAPPLPEHSITERIEFMMKKSGIAITITSLTDFLAFVIGATSVFRSIRYFCIYTGVAVLFCYLNQIFFLTPAVVINEKRVEQKRHYLLCCVKSKTKEDLEKDNKSTCYIACCAGNVPKDRKDLESPIEKYPKKCVKIILKSVLGKFFIVLLMIGYLIASIYGAINLKQGLVLYNLVSADSYFHKHSVWDEQYFTSEPVITLCITKEQNYSSIITQTLIQSTISKTKQDELIDSDFEINWLTSYKSTNLYNNSTEDAFIEGLMVFLTVAPIYANDIVIDRKNSKVTSSKIYVKSVNIKSTTDLGNMMLRIRDISQASALPCFFFSPGFIYFEQFVETLPSTLQTVGIAVAAMIAVTFMFMPKLLVVTVVGLTLVSILLGIFGFMYYWDLTLSSITMIHLVMSVGFSVDFSVHICHAFLLVDGDGREMIMERALDRSGGPIFNAAFSSLIGIFMLAFSNSYIFLSFGKLMFLVILFGLIHAAFFIPLVMYLILPFIKVFKNESKKEEVDIPLTVCSKAE